MGGDPALCASYFLRMMIGTKPHNFPASVRHRGPVNMARFSGKYENTVMRARDRTGPHGPVEDDAIGGNRRSRVQIPKSRSNQSKALWCLDRSCIGPLPRVRPIVIERGRSIKQKDRPKAASKFRFHRGSGRDRGTLATAIFHEANACEPDKQHAHVEGSGTAATAAICISLVWTGWAPNPVHSRTSYSNATPSGSFSLNHVSAASPFANTLR
jgi:hypothetical protein